MLRITIQQLQRLYRQGYDFISETIIYVFDIIQTQERKKLLRK